MLRFALLQMRASAGRLAAAAIAIILGTAFVAGSLMGTDITEATARSAFTTKLNHADVVVVDEATPSDVAAITQIEGVNGVDLRYEVPLSVGLRNGSQRYVEMDDLPTAGPTPKLQHGTLPTVRDEIVVTEDLAESLLLEVGDTLVIGNRGDRVAGRELKLTGILQPNLMQGSVPVLVTADTLEAIRSANEEQTAAELPSLLVYGDGARDATALQPEIAKVAAKGSSVLTLDQYANLKIADATGDAKFFVTFGLAFAAVSMIVAGMVISNTFEVLVAQRAQTLALMRCAGATKTQICKSVLLEAAVLGAVASAAGVVLGVSLVNIAVAYLRAKVIGIAVPGITGLGLEVFVAPVVVGILITVLSALGPAKLATQVSPVAALQPHSAPSVRASSRKRLVYGLAALTVGLTMLVLPALNVLRMQGQDGGSEEISSQLVTMLFIAITGGLLTVGATIALSVFLIPRVIRGMGQAMALLIPRQAASIVLATANAARNPRRTAATTSALVIGVGLVVMMATGAATARATLNATTNSYFPGDVWVYSQGPQDPDTAKQVAKLPGVNGIAQVWMDGAVAHTQAGDTAPWIADVTALNKAVPSLNAPVVEDAMLMNDLAWAKIGRPSSVTVDFPSAKAVSVKIKVVDGFVAGMLIPQALAEKHGALAAADSLVIDIDDAKMKEVVRSIEQVIQRSGQDDVVRPQIEQRAQYDQVIDAMLAALLGLLGVAVIIALVGVANTLTLSVIERRRENGMLRAVGVTAPQLRGMLAVEGILIALAGIVVGIVLGVVTGLSGAAILLGLSGDFVPSLDWRVMAATVVIAVVAGLLASVLPARNATKVPVVVALAN